MIDLDKARRAAADKAFADAEFGDAVVGETGSWQSDGDYWSLRVFWEQPEGPSVAGCFGVEFLPDADKVLETWSQ